MTVSSRSISSISCLMGNARRRVQCGIGTHLLRFPYPSIPSASTQRASSARMAMCWGQARSQAPQPTHPLARLWPCSAFVCVGAYMCATCLINKLSPGDLNQRPFPGPSSHSVAPCVWFLPTPSSGTSIGQGNRCGLFAWGRTGSKSSFGAVPKGALAAKRVSVQWLHSKRRPLLDIQPNSVVKTTELTARHESVWL